MCKQGGSIIQYRPALKISHTECMIKTGSHLLNCSPADLLANVSLDTRGSGSCGYVIWSVLVKCTVLKYKTTVVQHLYTLGGIMHSLYTFYVLLFGKVPFMMSLIWPTSLQPLLMRLVISHSRSFGTPRVFSRYRYVFFNFFKYFCILIDNVLFRIWIDHKFDLASLHLLPF